MEEVASREDSFGDELVAAAVARIADDEGDVEVQDEDGEGDIDAYCYVAALDQPPYELHRWEPQLAQSDAASGSVPGACVAVVDLYNGCDEH